MLAVEDQTDLDYDPLLLDRTAERLRLYGTLDDEEAIREAEEIVRRRNWERLKELCGAE